MLSKLRDVILPDVILNISTADGTLILKENAPDSKIKKLFIKGLPEQSFAFTLDHSAKKNKHCFKQLSCYLNPASEKVNKSCDLVIVVNTENKWQVLVLDMKSDKPSLNETEIQLLNSELYVKYLLSLVKHHFELDIPQVIYQRTMVTTMFRGVQKESIYKPNDGKFNRRSFRTVPVSVVNQEGHVHLRKLFDQ